MVDLNDNLGYVPVVRIETSDIALGGNETNQPNKALKELASRDQYLYEQALGGDDVAIASFARFKQAGIAALAQGRLTTETGVAVSTADRTAQTTLYYTPYTGDTIALFNVAQNRWDAFTFTERSLSLSGLAADTNYDIFLFDNSGTLTLQAVAWSSSGAGTSARNEAIAQLNGVWVKDSDKRRYLGTIRTGSSTGQTEDSAANRFIWNVENQVPRIALSVDDTFHSYTSATTRPVNNNFFHRVAIVNGLAVNIQALHIGNGNSDSVNTELLIGINSTSVGLRQAFGNNDSAIGTNPSTLIALQNQVLPIGFNFVQALQQGGANASFTGSGITFEWRA